MSRKPITVQRGSLSRTAPTKTEAMDKLDKDIDWACTYHAPWIESRFGLMAIVVATASGIEWRVLDPRELEHGKPIIGGSCMTSSESMTDQIMSVRIAMAQRAWPGKQSLPESDETFIDMAGLALEKRAELVSWVKWQREQIAERSIEAE